jgi:hypothetical protein
MLYPKKSLALIGNQRAKGNVLSPETRERMSDAHKGIRTLGHHPSEATRMLMAKSHTGKKFPNKKLSVETRAKISHSLIGNTRTLGYKKTELQRINCKQTMSSNAVRTKMAQAKKEYYESIGGKLPDEWKAKISAALVIRSKDPVYRAKLSDGKRKLWQREGYAEKVVSAVCKAVVIKPNKQEVKLGHILGCRFIYTGAGQLVIGGKCPDYWDGGNFLIELYGDYWHRGENPQDRIDFFSGHGYNCYVIWECELTDIETLYTKIEPLIKGG